MPRRLRGRLLHGIAYAAAVSLPLGTARSQTTTQEWWPELDGYWTAPSGQFRVFGMTSISRTADTKARQGTLGLHLDYLSLPWGYLRVGYRDIESMPPGTYHESRGLLEGTVGTDLGRYLRLLSRSRAEFRWIEGDPSQRLRERLQLERPIRLTPTRVVAPYATDEVYYDTQYHAISRNGYRFGADFRFDVHYNVDIYYARQDNRFGSVRHVNALGLTVGLRYGNVQPRR